MAEQITLEDVRALAAQCQTEMRRVSHELRPAILDELGLAEAVRALGARMAKHAHIAIDCRVEGDVDSLPADSVIACYRLVQEALNNVVRHANASSAHVSLTRGQNHLIVTVTDGRLTVSNASGAVNNKLAFLEITPVTVTAAQQRSNIGYSQAIATALDLDANSFTRLRNSRQSNR